MKLNKMLIASVALVTSLFSQGGGKVGSGGASELLIPVTARNIALGSSDMSTVKGIDAVQLNPAGLALTSNSQVAVTSMKYIADINVNFFGVSLKTSENSNIAIWGKNIDVGEIEVTTFDNPNGTNRFYSPVLFHGGVTYSNRMTDRINFGISAKYITERIESVSADGFAVDFGMQYIHESGISLGVALKNVGTDMQFRGDKLNIVTVPKNQKSDLEVISSIPSQKFSLPVVFEISGGYHYKLDDDMSTTAFGRFRNSDKSEKLGSAGLEFNYNDFLFVRTGVERLFENDSRNLFGAALGLGLRSESFSVDYAYRDVKLFDGNHVFTLSLSF